MAQNPAGQPIPPASPAGARQPRIPPAVDGIQVNHCKNPTCKNFGIPAKTYASRGSASHGGNSGDNYNVVAIGKGQPALRCHICGEVFPIKSNLGVAEELTRIGAPVWGSEPSCPVSQCANHAVPLSAGLPNYKAYGFTRSGSQRYQCLFCSKTFALGKPGQKQQKSYKNIEIFDRLMGKQPFARICASVGITMSTLYGKINLLHRQCTAFAAARENRLLMNGPARDRLYVCVDRQSYFSNWTQRSDRRNVQLMALGSADLHSGYVFGMHLNYDSGHDPDVVEQQTLALGDYNVAAPFRTHARLWLKQDYADAVARSTVPPKPVSDLVQSIQQTYQAANQRYDVEDPETPHKERKLPGHGVQVHLEYTLYGHFYFLARLLGRAKKVRFFLDQESGIRAALLAAFQDRVKAREVDAFYVRIDKGLMVWEKQQVLAACRKDFAQWQASLPGLTPDQVKTEMVKAEMRQAVAIGKWSDRWIRHPFPNMSEPEKAVCYLTDFGDYSEDHLAQLYLKASLHPIDRFFMQVRRRLSLLERPVGSASTAGRTWYGYSAYNPESIEKMLSIFRVYYNYVLKGQDGQTPAMRLGLARGPVTMEDIIRFDPHAQFRRASESPLAKARRDEMAEWEKAGERGVVI
jgi:hypothetical protein